MTSPDFRSKKHEVVVITGADAGIGRAIAMAFARRGARIALLARDAERLLAAARDVEAAGGRALPMPTDVADPVQVESAAGTAERELGPIDIWINNASATVFAPIADTEAQEYRRATEVTYLGTVYGSMAALRRMRPRNCGTIVQVGSALSYRAIPLQAAYCGAKFAVRGFTDSLRAELLHDRLAVRVTMVQLPSVNTPRFDWSRSKLPWLPRPLAPVFNPEVAAQAILYAISSQKREVCVGASTLLAVWRARLLPGSLDRYLARQAYRGQISDVPAESIRWDNLFAPAPLRVGSRGRFDREAKAQSWHLRLMLMAHRLRRSIQGHFTSGHVTSHDP